MPLAGASPGVMASHSVNRFPLAGARKQRKLMNS